MSTLTLALAQFNPILGDLPANVRQIVSAAQRAAAEGADVLLCPELALCGYPPEDLLLRRDFSQACNHALDDLATQTEQLNLHIVVGHPEWLRDGRFNAATVLHQGNAIARYQKMRLPNDSVFDECRYFEPGYAPCLFEVKGVKLGVLICEDMWDVDPASAAAEEGAQALLVLNASPFHLNKPAQREIIAAQRVEETHLPIFYCNMVGGQDELVFDGNSFAIDATGATQWRGASFNNDLGLIQLNCSNNTSQLSVAQPLRALSHLEASAYQALVLAVQDYIQKNRFKGVLLGLSGGIDSALTLAIAVDALGADKVHAVMMPSPYTANISIEDSRQMVQTLGVSYDEIDIKPLFEDFLTSLNPLFAGAPVDATEENLQARIRGTLLMALSNKTGKLVLTTGNKSEMSTGYATLYGDMAGGFAVLKDVAKTLVYRLAHYRNTLGECIPERIITRPPSAELRPDQTDQDSLPDYATLDAIVSAYVEHNQSVEQMLAAGLPEAAIMQVVRLIKINEYKRRQAAVGPRITHRAYGKDWRMPITNAFLPSF